MLIAPRSAINSARADVPGLAEYEYFRSVAPSRIKIPMPITPPGFIGQQLPSQKDQLLNPAGIASIWPRGK
jgi:hypothetical protein